MSSRSIYKKLTYSEDQFDQILTTQIQNGATIRKHYHGSRVTLYSQNKPIASTLRAPNLPMGDLSQAQINGFLAAFNKELYRYIYNCDNRIQEINFKGVSRAKYKDEWDKIEINQYIYNIDLVSAYWQIAHHLGYISDKFYEAYKCSKEYKQLKRYCISFLARNNRMEYIQPDGEVYDISCDTEILKRIYTNVRHALYWEIQHAIKHLPDAKDPIEFNIDGIMVAADCVNEIRWYFDEQGFDYQITECMKISDYSYLYKGKERMFVNSK